MNEKLKNGKGITLIALVVTIVVLLILAGVSISLILDNNGIIQKSKQARKEYGQAKENEQADLTNVSDWIDEAKKIPEIVEPENIDDWIFSEETDGTIIIKSYKGGEKTVTIPNYINGKPVKKIESGYSTDMGHLYSIWAEEICSAKSFYWYPQQTITEVIISEGIETIGKYAFMFSKALERVTIPSSVTTIDDYAFGSCENLTSVKYLGKEKNWNEIEINNANDNLINAEKTYNN